MEDFFMKPYIEKRTLLVAKHIQNSRDTIRKTAKIFNLSKSTVHNDLALRLRKIDKDLYDDVKKILEIHFLEKHIRGGEATRKKYIEKQK